MSLNSKNEKSLTVKEQLALQTSSNNSTTSSAESLTQTESSTMISQQTICYLISFSASDMSDALYFNELNVMQFLNQFKLLNENHNIENVILIKKLSEYCKSKIQEKIKAQEEYITDD